MAFIDAGFPPLGFMPFHIILVALIAKPYPEAYQKPLWAFGALQGLVEHYSDVVPQLATVGPLLVVIGLGLIAYHYMLAYQRIPNKTIVYGGLAGYVATLAISKGMELGFPKDTAEEQIAALKDDEYVFYHFFLHLALIASLMPTALNFPAGGPAAGKKSGKAVIKSA